MLTAVIIFASVVGLVAVHGIYLAISNAVLNRRFKNMNKRLNNL